MAKDKEKVDKAEKAEKPQPKPQPKEDKVNKKPKAGKELSADSQQRLDMLKTKRVFFLPLFLCGCLWVLLYSDPCNVKKKADCGYSGISALTCRSIGVYLREGSTTKRKIEIKRQPDTKLGIVPYPKDDSRKSVTIRSINQGAVSEHNRQLPWDSNETLRVGDRIVKVNSVTGPKAIEKELKSKKPTTFSMEILRRETGAVSSHIPVQLLSLLPFNAAQMITSPGMDMWLRTFSQMGIIGTACWLLSGYPAASLPLYYLWPSALIAWQSVRCCYDDQPFKQGDPHCYCGSGDNFMGVITKAWEKTTWKQTEKLFQW